MAHPVCLTGITLERLFVLWLYFLNVIFVVQAGMYWLYIKTHRALVLKCRYHIETDTVRKFANCYDTINISLSCCCGLFLFKFYFSKMSQIQ